MIDVLAAFETFFMRDAALVVIDVIDITIVAYLLYRVLLVIRGTRAMQMAFGLGLIFGGYEISRRMGLITLFTLLDKLLTSIVLIVIVVFQNDIRRALMRVGAKPIFRSARTARDTYVIDEVVKATSTLAQKRIGALIVFERDALLDDFIETGTRIDCEVSREVLHSIFIPSFENPMHDGAVVIREGRIWQAGALLPLTHSPTLDRSLGTRHRAAIGISEETDAVVIVVSEERGSISLCFNGNMVRNLEGNTLREALMGLFFRRSKKVRAKGEPGRPSLPPGRHGATSSSGSITAAPGENRKTAPSAPPRPPATEIEETP